MNRAAKRGILVIIGAALAILCLAAWWFLPGRRAEVRLPPRSAEAVPRRAIASGPVFLQTNPEWADERIGGSREPLRWVGCTICCLSMALACHGIELNPLELNRKLKEIEGYTFRGWVKWDAVRQVSRDQVRVELPQQPTNQDIESALEGGSPVLVKVLLKSGVQHWVLLVGRDGKEYLMMDPLGDGNGLAPLSSLGSDILAVRFVRKGRPRQGRT